PVKGLTLEARDFRGQIVFDPVHPKAIRVELRVPVRSLEPIAPGLDALERNEVIDWVRSSWILDMARQPEISFVGSAARFRGPSGGGYIGVDVPGRLEIHHRNNPATLSVQAKVTDEGVEVFGRHFVTLRTYDIIPLRDATGAYTIKRDVEV